MQIIGVDTGGTFTDLIFRGPDGWQVHKLLSTPDNPARAVIQGLEAVSEPGVPRRVVHGSTVATNAILERKGVRTALVTTAGFEDVIVIGRQNRSRLYDLAYRREPPIVPEELRFGVPGRILHSGEEHTPFDDDAAKHVAAAIQESGAESVAVCLLFSFANPDHERRMADALAHTGLPVSLSHEILAEFREFERTSTTVVNAYVSPRMRRYISWLREHLAPQDRLRVMQSNGGSISAETAMRESVRTILSGPAGGVVGALEIGRLAGFPRLITFDMGGTSTDVSLLDNALSMTLETSIAGYPVKTPMLDIHTVGAGGGSIARIDSGGALAVGPESAGADPGPICYGSGQRLTVTDANLFLGRLMPEHFLGGRMRLHREPLQAPMQAMADVLGLRPAELAEGVLDVANANMERAIRVISVERGFDPREFTLFSFGGAGGLHAVELARMLHMPRVLVPRNPGILSALGMLMADVIKDYSRTVMLPAAEATLEEIEAHFAPLESRAAEELAAEGLGPERTVLERFLDMRYEGQSFEIVTPRTPGADGATQAEAFHALHERGYGYRNPDKPVRIVNVRLRARGLPEKPDFEKRPLAGEKPPPEADLGARSVIFQGQEHKARVLQREALLPGNRVRGAAVLVEYSSTIFLPPDAVGRVDPWGNIVIEVAE
jgi:N-methylhydantoinase A